MFTWLVGGICVELGACICGGIGTGHEGATGFWASGKYFGVPRIDLSGPELPEHSRNSLPAAVGVPNGKMPASLYGEPASLPGVDAIRTVDGVPRVVDGVETVGDVAD